MKLRILAYNPGSESARLVSRAMDALILRREGSTYTPSREDFVINWGTTTERELANHSARPTIFNEPRAVRFVSDKLRFFNGSRGLAVPEWTTDRQVAATWEKCYARTETAGFNGSGIVVTRRGTIPPPAPLYVKGVPINREFRVYVAFGKVIDTQRKIAPRGATIQTWDVRTDRNGFLFSRIAGTPNQATIDACIAAVSHFNLDFGGVDVVEGEDGRPYVLEINTAPGIEGRTVGFFATAFKEKINAIQEAQKALRQNT